MLNNFWYYRRPDDYADKIARHNKTGCENAKPLGGRMQRQQRTLQPVPKHNQT